MNIFLYITVFIATAIGMKIIPAKFHRRIGIVLFIISIILIGPVVVSKTAEWRVKNIPILSTQQERERVKNMIELRVIIKSIHDKYDHTNREEVTHTKALESHSQAESVK